MSRPRIRHGRRVALALALLAILSACGKEGRPRPPEGEESRYTYPQIYPKPSSVLPQEEEAPDTSGASPAHAGGISVFPSTTRSKTTYDSEAAQ